MRPAALLVTFFFVIFPTKELQSEENFLRGFQWGVDSETIKRWEKGKLVEVYQGPTEEILSNTLDGKTIIPLNDVSTMIESVSQQKLTYDSELFDVRAKVEYYFWQDQLYKMTIEFADREFPNVSGYSETFLRKLLKVLKLKYGEPAREINKRRRFLTYYYDIDLTIMKMKVFYRSEDFSSYERYVSIHIDYKSIDLMNQIEVFKTDLFQTYSDKTEEKEQESLEKFGKEF